MLLNRRRGVSLVTVVVAVFVLLLQWFEGSVGESSVSRQGAVKPPLSVQGDKTYPLQGKVVAVTDGDTLEIELTDHVESQRTGRVRVRLANIDAPERTTSNDRPGQPYGNAARRLLADRVQGHTLMLICHEQDRYERHICDVPDPRESGVTVNQFLVLQGLAWANREGSDRFLRDETFISLQEQARTQKRGLWAEPDPVPPWVWRYQCWRNGVCG